MTDGTRTPEASPLEDVPMDGAATATIPTADTTTTTSTALTKKKKSRFGPTDILRATFYMMGLGSRRGGKKHGSAHKPTMTTTTTAEGDSTAATNSTLKLVGSVRPFYGPECVPENSPPRDDQPTQEPPPPAAEKPDEDGVEKEMLPPRHDQQPEADKPAGDEYSIQEMLPHPPTGEEKMLSAVSSAYWLVNDDGEPTMLYPPPAHVADEEQDGETTVDDENDDTYYDGIQGDDMIDAKAEVFISQFYKQMRNQELTPADRG